ncbi:baculoviral IAP repeat-containing protein 7 isoform X2 [Camelus bactrianus]|uniref:Baculoviral IAP repeat-containing protein 7 isoform X2 n=1 Tax=Camelus bactrianus TaxID=9837 RepID=A0AC58P0Z7_CAMBA
MNSAARGPGARRLGPPREAGSVTRALAAPGPPPPSRAPAGRAAAAAAAAGRAGRGRAGRRAASRTGRTDQVLIPMAAAAAAAAAAATATATAAAAAATGTRLRDVSARGAGWEADLLPRAAPAQRLPAGRISRPGPSLARRLRGGASPGSHVGVSNGAAGAATQGVTYWASSAQPQRGQWCCRVSAPAAAGWLSSGRCTTLTRPRSGSCPCPAEGQQDKVRCFFCYGGLQSWERGDDPWTEHARWFPRCEFLLRTKGRDFVCSVQESCCPPGSWDRSEEPEDTGPAAPSDAGDSQEWPAWSQCPAVQAVLGMGFGQGQVWQLLQRRYRRAVPTSVSASQLVADLLQEEDRGRAVGARGRPCGEAGGAQAQWVLVAPESPGARDAEEQLQRLREERTCRVCLDRTVAVVFVPCGHLACAECAPSLQLCPICRAPIGSCVRTFLS